MIRFATLLCACGIASTLPAGDAAAPRTTLDFNLYAQGRYVYERNCLVCHGARGDGNGELAKDVLPKPRSFREGWFKFRSTPYDKLPTEDDLRRTITGGLSGTAMGMFKHLSSDEVTAVMAYLKSFSRRWRKEENYAPALEFPKAPAWMNDAAAFQNHAARGRAVYSAMCAACHGPEADGRGPAAPSLKDAWGSVAKPSDLRQPHLRCGDAPEDLFRLLTTGMSGTPMAGFAQILTEDQRWDVIAHLLSIRRASLPVTSGR